MKNVSESQKRKLLNALIEVERTTQSNIARLHHNLSALEKQYVYDKKNLDEVWVQINDKYNLTSEQRKSLRKIVFKDTWENMTSPLMMIQTVWKDCEFIKDTVFMIYSSYLFTIKEKVWNINVKRDSDIKELKRSKEFLQNVNYQKFLIERDIEESKPLNMDLEDWDSK